MAENDIHFVHLKGEREGGRAKYRGEGGRLKSKEAGEFEIVAKKKTKKISPLRRERNGWGRRGVGEQRWGEQHRRRKRGRRGERSREGGR